MQRGVKFLSIIFSVFHFSLMGNVLYAQSSKINMSYTAPIGMQTLNPNTPENKNLYNKNFSGAAHSIISEIFKNTNVNLNYIPYDNYNSALQASQLHLSQNTLDFIIGITFDENTLKYLNYIPHPIYTDNIVIIVDNSHIKDKSILTKDLYETISNLSRNNIAITIDNLDMNLHPFQSFKEKDVATAMETVFNKNTFLILPFEMALSYLQDNKSNPKVKTLKILKYPNQVNYFIALNKNKTQEKIKHEGEMYLPEDFIKTRLNDMTDSGQLQQIIGEFKTK